MKTEGFVSETRMFSTIFNRQLPVVPEADNELHFFVPLGLTVCVSGEKELRVKLLRLKLEALVRGGGENAADQALETFPQVMLLTNTSLFSMLYVLYCCYFLFR